jgi:hypothetical protein
MGMTTPRLLSAKHTTESGPARPTVKGNYFQTETHYPTIEAAIFIGLVLILAGAGTWASVIG